MAEHLLFSAHMTAGDVHQPIAETYLGQAHIAGTGPDGKTCRECRFWAIKKYRKISDGEYEECLTYPGYFGKKHETHPLEIKKAKCNRPILNKANRLIPHSAKACRLFEPADNPPPKIKVEQ